MNRSLTKVLVNCCVVATLALVGCSSTGTGAASSTDRTISVNASAEVKIVPDKASVTFTTITQADSASEAEAQGAQAANSLVARLRELGIAEKSIQTTHTDLSPLYGSSAASESVMVGLPAASNDIVGYEMRCYVEVGDLDVDGLGKIISEAVVAGAQSVSGPRYYASNYDDAYREALTQAIENARQKAEVMARAGGVNLGGIVSMSEGYENRFHAYEETALDSAEMASGAEIQIEPGEVGVEASVSVTYELN